MLNLISPSIRDETYSVEDIPCPPAVATTFDNNSWRVHTLVKVEDLREKATENPLGCKCVVIILVCLRNRKYFSSAASQLEIEECRSCRLCRLFPSPFPWHGSVIYPTKLILTKN